MESVPRARGTFSHPLSFQAGHSFDIPPILPFFLPFNSYLLSIYYIYIHLQAVTLWSKKDSSINELTNASMFSSVYLMIMNLLGSLGCEMSISGLLCSFWALGEDSG